MQNTEDEIKVEGEEVANASVEAPVVSATELTKETGSSTVHSEDQEASTPSTDDHPSSANTGLADEPYEFERCTITASVVWLPADDHTAGRQMLVGVRSHLDAPILRVFREADLPLAPLPRVLETLLEELRTELPNRQVARLRQVETEAQKKPRSYQRASNTPKPASSSQIATSTAKGQAPTPAQLNLFQTLTPSPQETSK